jgi:hypothetical protein
VLHLPYDLLPLPEFPWNDEAYERTRAGRRR